MLQLTNNIDVSQSVPDDQPQAMIRHVAVEIRAADKVFARLQPSALLGDAALRAATIYSRRPLIPMPNQGNGSAVGGLTLRRVSLDGTHGQ